MTYVTLIPGILCAIAILRWGSERAFLYVVLPVLLLFPTNFYLSITHFPDLNFLDVTLLILGLGMMGFDVSRWKFTRMDILVVVFIFSCGYSEWTHYGFWRVGALAIIEGVIPYMAGKLLLEPPGMSLKVIRQFVILVCAGSAIGMYEFFFKINPYAAFWLHFYPDQWGLAPTQIRWGRGRMSGPYVQSEFAGMVLFTALLLAIWAIAWRLREGQAGWLKHPRLVIVFLVLAILMTQARGPWIGLAVALAVASIGRAQRPLRRAFAIVAFLVVVGIPAYQAGKDYISGPRTNYGSERETAQYRAELIDNYIPLAESGGAWGFGRSLPILSGQGSIDNEYLFVWLVQGYVGLVFLLLLLLDASFTLVRLGLKTRALRERHLILTLFGIWAGIMFTITTVWLGGQTFELMFLLLGWSQAIHPAMIGETLKLPEIEQPLPEFSTMTVYT